MHGCAGDGDPLDVVEIGPDPILSGRVHAVKVLGILGMIDSGETDWKVIAISRQDPDLFHALHNIEDVDTHLPGKLDSIRDWFRYYKVAEGKSESQFAFQGKFQDQVCFVSSFVYMCVCCANCLFSLVCARVCVCVYVCMRISV